MTRAVLITKLRKILALAERGESGERIAAEHLLEELLDKHGLTLEDITPEPETRKCSFTYETTLERDLLIQIAVMVTDNAAFSYGQARHENVVQLELTVAQQAEVITYFSVYRPALQRELHHTLVAFLQANEIFPTTVESVDEDDLSPEDRRVHVRSLLIEPTPVHRMLGETEDFPA